MPVLTLAETLAVPAPERDSLVDADDAIRDLVSAVEEAVRRDGLDQRLVSRAPSLPNLSARWLQRLSNGRRDAERPRRAAGETDGIMRAQRGGREGEARPWRSNSCLRGCRSSRRRWPARKASIFASRFARRGAWARCRAQC